MTEERIKLEINKIVEKLKEYKEKTNCKGVVIGISGGKDSTTVAMLAKLVWGENVFGILMPNGDQKDIGDSLDIVRTLNINHEIINISYMYDDIIEQIAPTEKAASNIAPRLRMTVLYAKAQTLGYRVIGTGNYSESYIGWTTKWGDSACDINPIAHLNCSDVIDLGKSLAKQFSLDEKFIIKDPADGLTGRTDEENFGFTYKELDAYIERGTSGNFEIDKKIAKMHQITEHKRNMPYNIYDIHNIYNKE